MGSGASSLVRCVRCDALEDKGPTKCEDITDLDEIDLYNQLTKGENVQNIRVFSKVCGNGYLLSIWDLILVCESSIVNSSDIAALGFSLLSHENLFPMCSEFMACCDGRNAQAQIKVFIRQIKLCCFRLIYSTVYIPLIAASTCQNNSISTAKLGCNYWISSESFNYLGVIAKGGFGVVAQVQLKSNGEIFAMKIQPKIALLRQFRRVKSRITSELAASVVFEHPFVASIAYAFHTETLTMLVAPISACGDLHTIAGTMAFMAPEILILYGQRKLHEDGYTRAVDFWSLGIMIYKLLTGVEPYPVLPSEAFQMLFKEHLSHFNNYQDAFNAFFGIVNYDICNGLFNEQTRSLMEGLLKFHADDRLGYNIMDMQAGFDALMNHPFFDNINWDLLETKQMPPPYLPQLEVLPTMTDEVPKSLCDILLEANRARWCEEFGLFVAGRMTVHPKDQHYFSKWYYAGK